ncbi:MAG: hypothetical protein R8K46_01245 [Mariprofundaceae bacterium]
MSLKSTTPHWIAIMLLLAAVAGIGIKFAILGNTGDPDGADDRTQVLLNAGERQAVLFEMRSLLKATQQIIDSLADNNMKQIVDSASSVGMQATSTMDITLKARLPLEFKQLGFATHQAFDDIAAMASQGQPANEIQRKLAEAMNNCQACHASYQIPSINQNQSTGVMP